MFRSFIYPVLFLFGLFSFFGQPLYAQKIIFSENFESKTLDSSWKKLTGNWRIGDVQEMRIAPAEDGYRYVLCSDSPGYIRLFVDIPDSVKATQVKIKFSYYTYSEGPGGTVEAEFHKRGWKDGARGKLWKVRLPVKGKWTEFQKTLKIPPEANSIWIEFYRSAASSSKMLCFDAITISALK
jgi:hypothetical protein